MDVANIGSLTHVVAATLKCMAISPNTPCQQGGQFDISKFFTPAELSSLHKNPLATTADSILKQCRQIAKSEGCSIGDYNKLTGRCYDYVYGRPIYYGL